MNIAEIRKSRRKKITLPGGLEVEIRKISPLDLLAAGGNPDLAALLAPRPPKESPGPEDMARLRRFAEEMALRAAVRPRLKRGAEDAADALDVADLTADELMALMAEALKFSGLTREAARDVLPLSGADGGSSPLTPPPAATPAAPAPCSESATPSPHGRLTCTARGRDGNAKGENRE